jgi:threonine aldolase
MSHLRTHEENAFVRLHGLQEVLATGGSLHEPIRLETLKNFKEPLGALLLELPQRDMGGYLPTWNELVAQTKWAKKNGVALHLDGARLWEAAPYYAATAKKSIKDICALFDTVYVSFYKGLGGISGSCVAGTAEIIDEVSLWRTRHGGRAYMLWPYAASALNVVKSRPKDMAAYYRRAVALSKKLRLIEGIEVLPGEVRSPMMHLRFSATKEQMEERVRKIATEQKIMTLPGIFLSESANLQRYEFQVGQASMGFTLVQMVDLFRQLAGQ